MIECWFLNVNIYVVKPVVFALVFRFVMMCFIYMLFCFTFLTNIWMFFFLKDFNAKFDYFIAILVTFYLLFMSVWFFNTLNFLFQFWQSFFFFFVNGVINFKISKTHRLLCHRFWTWDDRYYQIRIISLKIRRIKLFSFFIKCLFLNYILLESN